VRRIRALPRQFACDDRLRRATDELLNLFQSPPNDITRIAVHTALLTWLLALVSRGTENIVGRATPEMMRVLDLVDSLAALPEYPRMATLASAAGLSVSRLKSKFRRQIGIPPMEFVTRRKISLAMNRLRDNPDETVTQIAMDLGFASSQYFASVFRRITNRSPTDYRKALRQNGSAPDPKPAPSPACQGR
jgi:AraC-like DNA-binding protein